MGSARLVIIIFIFGLFSCTVDNDTGENPPNILVLIADDAGHRDFGCYGNDNIATPNIDRLAENGLKFNNAFLTIAQCSPSRISILSGLYPHSTGAEDLHMDLPDGIKLIPSYLKEKNYFSGILLKSHLGPNGDKQFDYYSKSLDDFDSFLDSAKTNPFFMWVGFTDPHRPYAEGIIENPQDPEKVIIPPFLVDNIKTREDLAGYYNEIMRMDSKIGEYIEILKSRNLLDNTFIVFLSDNGAPFPREKGTVYDSGIKTPLIFSWNSNLSGPIEYMGLTSVIDLAPTILDLAGINIPNQMHGSSIKNTIFNRKISGRDYIFAERNWHNCDEHIRSVRSGKFKLISNSYIDLPFGTPADISKSPSWLSLYELKQKNRLSKAQSQIFEVPRPEYEFYDLEKDPNELNNVINSAEYKDEIDKMKTILQNWRDETGDFSPDERQRKDNTDRITGIKFDQTRLPPRK